MTLQEAKDKTAINYGYENHDALIDDPASFSIMSDYVKDFTALYEKELYAKHQAMEFAEWVDKTSTQTEDGYWLNPTSGEGTLTTKELYNTFKNK